MLTDRPSTLTRLARSVLPRPARNWLRSPGQSAHYIYDEGLFRLGVIRRHEIRPGWRPASHPGAFRMAFWAQVHDPAQVSELDGFVATCRPGMVLFDVGAHFGLFSLAALHYGPAAWCLAVEPSVFAARMLQRHACLNALGDRLVIRHAAAGGANGTARMVDVGIQARGYFIHAEDSRPSADVTLVDCVTVDALAAEYGPPTHLKIDVEGDEAAVLAGAATTLSAAGARPVVFLELHNEIIRRRGEAPARVLEALSAAGYRLETSDRRPLAVAAALGTALTRLVAWPGD